MSRIGVAVRDRGDVWKRRAAERDTDDLRGGGHRSSNLRRAQVMPVLGKDAAGRKDLGTRGGEDAISQSLKYRRGQLLRSAHTNTLRIGAVIENLIASRVVESRGKVHRSRRRRQQRSRGSRCSCSRASRIIHESPE